MSKRHACNVNKDKTNPKCSHQCAKTAAAWKAFNNFCVDSTGKDLPQTPWKAGATNKATCQRECVRQSKCSAYEWYDSGWGGSKCHLMLGKTPSSKGYAGGRWQDALCYVKPTKTAGESHNNYYNLHVIFIFYTHPHLTPIMPLRLLVQSS